MDYNSVLEFIRGILLKIAGALEKIFPFPQENIYAAIIIILSLFLASQAKSLMPSKLSDNWLIYLAIAGGVFYILYYL